MLPKKTASQKQNRHAIYIEDAIYRRTKASARKAKNHTWAGWVRDAILMRLDAEATADVSPERVVPASDSALV